MRGPQAILPHQSQKDPSMSFQHGFYPQHRTQQEGQYQRQLNYQSVSRTVVVPPVLGPQLTNLKFNRLSQRLQRNDRTVTSPSFHLHARPSGSPKKSTSRGQLSPLNPSTTSSSTLNSSLFLITVTQKQPGLRRSFPPCRVRPTVPQSTRIILGFRE